MVGIVVSNSILIVEFTHRLREDGKPLMEAIALACRVRLRPVLMTSLATLIGLIPMAAKLGTGSEGLRATGAGHHRRTRRIGRAHHVHCSGGLSAGVSPGARVLPTRRGLIRRRRHEAPNCSLAGAWIVWVRFWLWGQREARNGRSHWPKRNRSLWKSTPKSALRNCWPWRPKQVVRENAFQPIFRPSPPT